MHQPAFILGRMELVPDLTFNFNINNLKAQPFFKKAFSESLLLCDFIDFERFLIFMGVEDDYCNRPNIQTIKYIGTATIIAPASK